MHHSSYRTSSDAHSSSWVVAVGGTSPSPSSLPDAGVLALGASAGLNHDQRRAVLQRVEEIDSALAEARNALQAEDGAARELVTARARAHAENLRLRDESIAVLDAVRVGGVVWRGLNVGGGTNGGGGGNGSEAPRTGDGTTASTVAGTRATTAESELEALRRGQAAARKLLVPKEVRDQLQALADEIAAAEADIAASPVAQWKERSVQLDQDQRRAHRELGELAERRRALETAHSQMVRQYEEAQRREAQQVRIGRIGKAWQQFSFSLVHLTHTSRILLCRSAHSRPSRPNTRPRSAPWRNERRRRSKRIFDSRNSWRSCKPKRRSGRCTTVPGRSNSRRSRR